MRNRGVLISHPTGNENVRAVLRALNDVDRIYEFHTTIHISPILTELLFRFIPKAERLRHRSFTEVVHGQIKTHTVRESIRITAKYLRWGHLDRHETGWASVDSVYRALDRAVASRIRRLDVRKIHSIYAYEDGAYSSFSAAKAKGIRCLYDLPIAHWRTLRSLLEEEFERWPDWAPTMEGLRDSDEKHERKDAEVELADRIFVASTFTRQSLTNHFGEKLNITVLPYGCPPPRSEQTSQRRKGEPLRLFYAGQLTQRKGVADLIVALKLLEIDWTLTLAGPLPTAVPAMLQEFLSDHRCKWIGVIPHAQLLARMAEAHLFIFPSIVEGFGLVITEAMASGLPVITTPHTAGPDLITDGKDGFIVPIRASGEIAERVTRLEENEDLRCEIANNALATARSNSWKTYEAQIAALVADI